MRPSMAEKFKSFYINHVPRQQNAYADALASLAASLDLPAGATGKYSSKSVICTAQDSLLKILSLQKETFK